MKSKKMQDAYYLLHYSYTITIIDIYRLIICAIKRNS